MMNSGVITQLLDGHISRSRRYHNALSLLRARYAFPDGMEAQLFTRYLQRIALFLKDKRRWADQIGMSDKSAFLVILPATNYEAAATLLKKFNDEKPLALFARDDGRPLSFSVGLTEWSKDDTTKKMRQTIR
jgi:GGDEF domain-containing protein